MRKSKGKEGLSRLLAILLISSTLFGLTACGDNSGSSEPSGIQGTSSSQQSSSQQSSSQQSSSTPTAASEVTKEEWQEAYKELLLKSETYSSLGGQQGQVDLLDLDGNGVPEIYISTGYGRDQMLCSIYDFSSGIIDINKEINMPYNSTVAVHKKTGQRVISGTCGGTGRWEDYILIPKTDRLDFEKVTISESGKDYEGGSGSTQVSKDYKLEDFEIQFGEEIRSLTVDGYTIPEDQGIYDLLDIRIMNPGSFEKCMDGGVTERIVKEPIENFIYAIQRLERSSFNSSDRYRYNIKDFQADKNKWGLELIDICNSNIEPEIEADEETLDATLKYPADKVDAYTQRIYGFTMDKGEKYQDGYYITSTDSGFYEAPLWLQGINHVLYVNKELQIYFVRFDVGHYWHINGEPVESTTMGDAVIQLVDTDQGKQVRIYEINIGCWQDSNFYFKPYIEMATNELK